MALHAPRGTTSTPVPAGTHIARLYQIVHIGTVHYQWQGEDKAQDKIRLTFELCNERKEFKEGEGERPFSVSREFGFTMSSKGNLRKFVEGMLGVAFHDDEAYGFDIETLLGDACLINVVHEEKNGNTYANIASASPLPKGMTAPELFNTAVVIDVNSSSEEMIRTLPDFLQDKIKGSDEWKKRFGDRDIHLGDDEKMAESNPF